MQLYLIRHPKPDIASGICYGQSDVASSEMQCQLVLPSLRAILPASAKIYSSPLQRCTLLAAHLASDLQVPAECDARLMEMNFGRWELQHWDRIPRAEIDAWANDVSAYRPGGAENLIDMASRLIDFLQEIFRLWQAEKKDVIVVSHAGSMRLMLAYQAGISPEALARRVVADRQAIDFGECRQLQL
ncbi:alpha-ribazole phosphatase family protein [Undibacterium sp. Jales W-56]|uniref:alpha-ribazole phosphatase family protein n=1 Tax=Undibacterium sp. Jales W-56 TaxID=2897325 RepID=UPI0021D191BD|nr:alpha-ribazole phosphatase family protein [Undibacterium sp. Jales W-56]MCU6433016.1 alpha-ribazole phosphatase family protein [Undibacterium sp. Jales W-56]